MKTIFINAFVIMATAIFHQLDAAVLETTNTTKVDAATDMIDEAIVKFAQKDDVNTTKLDDEDNVATMCESDSGSSNLVEPFSLSELVNLLRAFRNANFTDADLAVLEEVSLTSVEHLKAVTEVLKKIDVDNLQGEQTIEV